MNKWTRLRLWLQRWDAGELNFSYIPPAREPEKEPENQDWQHLPMQKVEQAEELFFHGIYPVLATVLCSVIIFFMLLTVADLPSFGEADIPTNNEVSARYLEKGLEETGAVNAVAGMILDYRAFDTLGESHVLFTATVAVLILLLTAEGIPEPKVQARIMEQDPILRQTARVIVPMAILYGIYVILNGHLGPGGGFSGGAIIGGGLILYAIAFGFERLDRILNIKVFRTVVLCALCFYSTAKCYSFFCGAHGLHTIFTTGIPGAIFSAGLILPLNIAVGLVVACTMYGFYSLFQRGRI